MIYICNKNISSRLNMNTKFTDCRAQCEVGLNIDIDESLGPLKIGEISVASRRTSLFMWLLEFLQNCNYMVQKREAGHGTQSKESLKVCVRASPTRSELFQIVLPLQRANTGFFFNWQRSELLSIFTGVFQQCLTTWELRPRTVHGV